MHIRISCSRNPLIDALAERDFGTPEFQIEHDAVPVMELFERALEGKPLEVVEFSLANYLMAVDRGNDRYIALPVFPFRGFRHSMLWVRKDSGIDSPEMLRGKRIGAYAYALTALVYVRGLLSDEYGVHPEDVEWVRTGHERIDFDLPPKVKITDLNTKKSLFSLLAEGKVDAIIAFWSPGAPTSGVRRLFSDVREAEAAYFRRTRVYPIMHCMVMSRDLHRQHPELGRGLMRLFERAKQSWHQRIAAFGAEITSVTPWTPLDIEWSQDVLGSDLFPYGLEPNMTSIQASLRYMQEQKLVLRDIPLGELFIPL